MNAQHKTNAATKHGVLLDVLGLGVLLTGVSGIGKSELALGLINRRHKLVADDLVTLEKSPTNQLIGLCPPILQNFLEVRGLGVLNIRALFGDNAIKEQQEIHLIINMIHISRDDLHHIDRLHGMHRVLTLEGVEIPEVSLPVAPGRNLAILVECAVRNQLLKNKGYDACDDFIKRQRLYMKRESE